MGSVVGIIVEQAQQRTTEAEPVIPDEIRDHPAVTGLPPSSAVPVALAPSGYYRASTQAMGHHGALNREMLAGQSRHQTPACAAVVSVVVASTDSVVMRITS